MRRGLPLRHRSRLGEAAETTKEDDEAGADPSHEGLAALVASLRAAADDLAVFTFLPSPTPRYFWARRQAHETAIDRADAQAAAGGDVTAFNPDFA